MVCTRAETGVFDNLCPVRAVNRRPDVIVISGAISADDPDPIFKDQLYFVYLNKKRNSQEAIKEFATIARSLESEINNVLLIITEKGAIMMKKNIIVLCPFALFILSLLAMVNVQFINAQDAFQFDVDQKKSGQKARFSKTYVGKNY